MDFVNIVKHPIHEAERGKMSIMFIQNAFRLTKLNRFGNETMKI